MVSATVDNYGPLPLLILPSRIVLYALARKVPGALCLECFLVVFLDFWPLKSARSTRMHFVWHIHAHQDLVNCFMHGAEFVVVRGSPAKIRKPIFSPNKNRFCGRYKLFDCIGSFVKHFRRAATLLIFSVVIRDDPHSLNQ